MKKLLITSICAFFCIYIQAVDSQSQLKVSSREHEQDARRKMQECIRLTANGVRHFKRVSLAQACEDFIYNPTWRKGDIFLVVYDQHGMTFAHGDDADLIWKSGKHLTAVGGESLLKQMLDATEKGTRISYYKEHAFKSAYVRTVVKNGVKYIIAAGFFPEDVAYSTKELVRSAARYVRESGSQIAFGLIDNQNGPFIRGDIYLFAYDFDGICLAHGLTPSLIGQNQLDRVDDRGRHYTRDMIELAKTKGQGWVEYNWKGTVKRSYVERVVDPKTKKPLLIAGGYYLLQNFDTLKSFVHRAVAYLKENGAQKSFAEFTNQIGSFIQGGLEIVVYDLNGMCVANGEDPSFVGQNMMNFIDQNGRHIVKEMIEVADKFGQGLISYYRRNAEAVSFVIKVDVPDGKFVIASEFYPDTKTAATETLVNKAVAHLNNSPTSKAFSEFTVRDNGFHKGDLAIFVYDDKGVRYVNGPLHGQLWHNFIKSTDQEGKPVVSDLITTAINGGGWLSYTTRNATRRIFVKAVEKSDLTGVPQQFIVGSGFFK